VILRLALRFYRYFCFNPVMFHNILVELSIVFSVFRESLVPVELFLFVLRDTSSLYSFFTVCVIGNFVE
jgi:hypothetical protein